MKGRVRELVQIARRLVFSTVFVVAVMVLFANTDIDVLAAANEHANKVETIAHRGASGYAPENTMAAFEKAVEMKADYIELDVQMSEDGKLVIMHDTTVDRTTNGDGKIAELTWDELKKLDAGSWFGPAFAGERIPTFGKVLDQFRGKIGLLIELKSPSLYPGIEQKVAQALKKRDMNKPNNRKIIVQSFDFHSMQIFHHLLPDIPIGVLTYAKEQMNESMLQQFSSYADYVNPSQSLINPEIVDDIHQLGMGVMAWTVDDREEVPPLINAGVDGIITNYPDYVPKSKDRN